MFDRKYYEYFSALDTKRIEIGRETATSLPVLAECN